MSDIQPVSTAELVARMALANVFAAMLRGVKMPYDAQLVATKGLTPGYYSLDDTVVHVPADAVLPVLQISKPVPPGRYAVTLVPLTEPVPPEENQ